jgi:predicted Zn-dependent protease with MMP-like domain
MKRKEFEDIVLKAMEELPQDIIRKIKNLAVVVEDLPSRELMEQMGLQSPYELLGFYQGVPLGKRGHAYGNVLPDRIILFQRCIERSCRSENEIPSKVRDVLYHEIGHYLGLGEDDLQRMIPQG